MESILLILGPSGAGKTHLADYMAKDHRMLHVNFDHPQHHGVTKEGLLNEWKMFLDQRDPTPLAGCVRRSGHLLRTDVHYFWCNSL